MNESQQAAYVIAQAACASAEIAAMSAENQHRISTGHTIVYSEQDFRAVIDRYGISHNAVIGLFRNY